MRFLIIRHAEPYYPTDSLTEKGYKEAELLSNRLVKEHITKAYVSALGRAKLTAKPTLDKLGIEAEELFWLREFPRGLKTKYVVRGGAENSCPWNMPPEDWMRIPGVWDPEAWKNAPIYAGTGIPEAFEEISANLDALCATWGFVRNETGFYDVKPGYEESTDTVALFCHLGLGNALLAHFMHASLPFVWHTLFLPVSSVTTVMMEMHREHTANARLVSVGDTSHLFAGGEPISASGLYASEIR